MIVAGGGIGGLSAALSLAKNGFETTVLEQDKFAEIGAGIYHPASAAAKVRDTVMGSKTLDDWYDDLQWLYGGNSLEDSARTAREAH